MLSDALKRADPYSTYKFSAILSGGRLHRSKLVIRWNGGKVVPNKNPVNAGTPTYVDEYTLTTVGCATQLQADDFVATIALFCIDRDKSVQRALPLVIANGGRSSQVCRRTSETARADLASSAYGMSFASGWMRRALPRRPNPRPPLATTRRQQSKPSSASCQPPLLLSRQSKSQEITEYFSNRVASPSYQKMLPGRQGLPIANHRQEILDLVESNQIFVLSGETGCVKSTQVPAYILEHCMSQGRNCKIYVTEPRRISAISLAERVSEELGEPRKSVGNNDSWSDTLSDSRATSARTHAWSTRPQVLCCACWKARRSTRSPTSLSMRCTSDPSSPTSCSSS